MNGGELTPVPCYLCEREAVGRCYACGQLICERHGGDNCARCDAAIVAGDPRPDRVRSGLSRRPDEEGHAWWHPQRAEEYQPPACYECEGIARYTCRNCEGRYCGEHAGPPGLCRACGRSSWIGIVLFLFALAMMALILLLNAY